MLLLLLILLLLLLLFVSQLPIALLHQQENKQDLKRTELNKDYGYISSCFFTYYTAFSGLNLYE